MTRRRSPNLARLDDAGFRARFAGGPIKRIGRARFLRNVMIAIGNSGEPALAAAARERLDDAIRRWCAARRDLGARRNLLPREELAEPGGGGRKPSATLASRRNGALALGVRRNPDCP